MNTARLNTLDAIPSALVWRGNSLATPAEKGLPTGFALLDVELPGGGWPRSAITELLCDHPGSGEIALLQPLLHHTPTDRWMAWVSPPWLPYAPALSSAGLPLTRLLLIEPTQMDARIWATRQALSSGACHAVLAWIPRIDTSALRRLQLAAEASATPLFLFRPSSVAARPSPAALRLQLEPDGAGVRVTILKRRGAMATAALRIPIPRPGRHHDAVDNGAPARPAVAGIHTRSR